MIEVTPEAWDYLRELTLNKHRWCAGLKVHLSDPGTPGADCELHYLKHEDVDEADLVVQHEYVNIFVSPDSMQWLEGAVLDYQGTPIRGDISLTAPNLKGRPPDDDAPLQERVQWVLVSQVNPMVASHGGHVVLDHITDDNIAVLRFGGGCHGCGMVDVTLKQGIETKLKEAVPEIAGVADATDHATGTQPYYPS